MGLTVITTYLRPPEKWSLFGRTKHFIKANISPFKTFEGGIRQFVYKMDLEVAELL